LESDPLPAHETRVQNVQSHPFLTRCLAKFEQPDIGYHFSQVSLILGQREIFPLYVFSPGLEEMPGSCGNSFHPTQDLLYAEAYVFWRSLEALGYEDPDAVVRTPSPDLEREERYKPSDQG